MRKFVLSLLVLAGLLLAQAGWMENAKSNPRGPYSGAGSLSIPVTGVDDARTNAAALIFENPAGPAEWAIVPVSAANGEPFAGKAPLELGTGMSYGFSQDRSQMAVVSYNAADCSRQCLRLLDLRTWQETTPPISVHQNRNAWFTIPDFDPAGGTIPLLVSGVYDSTTEIMLVDRNAGEVAVSVKLEANVYRAATTPDGSLAVYGVKRAGSQNEQVIYTALLDAADLSLLWEQTLPQIHLSDGTPPDHSDPLKGRYYDPARIFAPDGSKLYVVAADEPTLVTVDYQTRTVNSSRIAPRLSWLQRLLSLGLGAAQAKILNGVYKNGVTSPDGRYLYVIGQEYQGSENDKGDIETKTVPLGIQVIDTTDGALVREFETDANQLYLSHDGKSLLLNGWEYTESTSRSWTKVLDLATGKVTRTVNTALIPSRLLDGSTAWLSVSEQNGVKYTISLYRPGDSAPRSQITRNSYVDWVIIP